MNVYVLGFSVTSLTRNVESDHFMQFSKVLTLEKKASVAHLIEIFSLFVERNTMQCGQLCVCLLLENSPEIMLLFFTATQVQGNPTQVKRPYMFTGTKTKDTFSGNDRYLS